MNQQPDLSPEAVRERVKMLLARLWRGNQRVMAHDLKISQANISLVVSGRRPAGKRLLTTLANHDRVNAEWLTHGIGEPLKPQLSGTLPISLAVLPGLPSAHPQMLSGQRHPVAAELDRTSRYWLKMQPTSPLIRDKALRVTTGDLLLMEADPVVTNRLDIVVGRICGVRIRGLALEPVYGIGKLCPGAGGHIFDLIERTVPVIEPPTRPLAGTGAADPAELRSARKRRTIRNLEVEEQRAEGRRRADERDRADPSWEAWMGYEPMTTLLDIVAVCVYLARPNPVVSPGRAPQGRGLA